MRGGHLVRDARHQIELRGPDWQKLRSPMTVALAPGQATNLISRLRTKLISQCSSRSNLHGTRCRYQIIPGFSVKATNKQTSKTKKIKPV